MKLDPVTLKALKESIAIWKAKVKEDPFIGTVCPLCALFRIDRITGKEFPEKSICAGCPVYAHTGVRRCGKTPYVSWCDAAKGDSGNPAIVRKGQALVVKEYKFLESLIPKGQR